MLLSLHKQWLESKILIFVALFEGGRFSVTDALKFRDFFCILQYLDRGIPYALLCLACFVCSFRGFHIQKEKLQES